MSLKEEFLVKVKSYFPNFNPETDRVVITFDGGGDNFNSFYKARVTDSKDNPLVGEWNCDDDMDFLFQIMDESKVFYHWVSCNMNGEIIYANKRLWVTNTNCNEPDVWADSYDEDGNPLDSDGERIAEEDLEWDCEDYKGSVMSEGEEDYDVTDLLDSGLTIDEDLERKRLLELSNPKPVSITPTKKKNKTTQKKNGKKVVKRVTKKKVVKKVSKKKPVMKVTKKKLTKRKKVR